MSYDFKDLIPAGGAGGKIRYRISDNAGTVIYPSISLDYAEPLLQQGDRVGAKMMNQLAMKDALGNPVTTLVSQHDFYDMVMEYTHQKVGSVHRLTSKLKAVERTNAQGGSLYPPSGRIRQVQFVAVSGYLEGESFVVDGKACMAKQQGGGSELLDGFFVAGDLVGALLLDTSPQAKLVFRSGGKPSVPSIFGNGSDGDLYIAAGQTVVLPVPVPHQSVVEKQYKSVTIAAGGVLRCSAPNAGLVIRCKGSFTCHGTIDQSLMSPKPNPANNYRYPSELVCGKGGAGGNGGGYGSGNAYGGNGGAGGANAMRGLPYGGGYGAGGGGGGAYTGHINYAGAGGDSNTITIHVPQIFIGGAGSLNLLDNGNHGAFGGGGAGRGAGGAGGSGNGGDAPARGANMYSGGGGAGNCGGGVLLIYVAGSVHIDGSVLCEGGTGGKGCNGGKSPGSAYGDGGGGGGGGGGGAIYILHNSTILITGRLSCNGGFGGAGGVYNTPAEAGKSGAIGTITVKKYVKGMTV